MSSISSSNISSADTSLHGDDSFTADALSAPTLSSSNSSSSSSSSSSSTSTSTTKSTILTRLPPDIIADRISQRALIDDAPKGWSQFGKEDGIGSNQTKLLKNGLNQVVKHCSVMFRRIFLLTLSDTFLLSMQHRFVGREDITLEWFAQGVEARPEHFTIRSSRKFPTAVKLARRIRKHQMQAANTIQFIAHQNQQGTRGFPVVWHLAQQLQNGGATNFLQNELSRLRKLSLVVRHLLGYLRHSKLSMHRKHWN